MKPALVLVDLQHDFLRSPALEPPASAVIGRAAALLRGCRSRGIPVIHVCITIRTDDDRRMPHWKRDGTWLCVAGTPGHEPPASLAPLATEPVVHKTSFSAFAAPEMDRLLTSLGIDALWVAGVHLHGCVRATALDAYQRGFAVRVAGDAVASDDPVHAAATRRYLAERGIAFASVEQLLRGEEPATAARATLAAACARAREAFRRWRATPLDARAEMLRRFAALVERDSAGLARGIAVEVAKPLRYAAVELARTGALVEAAIRHARGAREGSCGPESEFRHQPLGVVAAITPWNNPVAIPVGKIAPALLFGNTVTWKPSPRARATAAAVHELLRAAGCPDGVVELLDASDASATALLLGGDINAVAFTGSPGAGRAVQELCARRFLPLQAELGGNNAAIVCTDADLRDAAARVAEAAFGFAGQRCTANRRVIVERAGADRFVDELRQATAELPGGDPLDPQTIVGPLVSADKRDEIAAAATRAGILFRGRDADLPAYHPPVAVRGDDPQDDIVRHETFGPLLVVQQADDLDEALALNNAVPQGLVAAIFTSAPAKIERFLDEAQAGILKINAGTADADAEAPFGGWKASGIGPPEHGASDREFYTRTQAIYRLRLRV
ncbi:MAG: aldehyde dehydrogenase family protein [Acidobacteria bacterium]|nr:aldehyde dehydrogenase family protein [Acidobacteriota bacterium]